MASYSIAHPSAFLGAGTASSAAIAAPRSRSSSDASSSSCPPSSSHVFYSTREATFPTAAVSAASATPMTSLSGEKQVKFGYANGRRRLQERTSGSWTSFEDLGSDSSLLPRAKRKNRGGGGRNQEEEAEAELDEDLQVGLNEISTEALKAMLSEYDKEVAQVREKVEYLGKYLVQENQLDAARFMLVLRGMLDHEVVPQKDDLKGAYKKAFDKMASVIEDSGWVLKQEGADVGGVEMVDDELMPPVLNSQY